ncbi:two-component system histidine kinase PnpS [Desulfuribacillus alkaliarsenatis]|uniref:histidine kinase n=1 Tax=Desulfuribacillus alkaliarsenatis TaxID=766136 RepID=A0A1E5FYE8_9FIRM|nr:HAMP domain-containing sensor histidine kinase [Desulfuribacillus alkaliarsenatis]OEF95590.1 hypothetical protein BHF68_12110 [Desulfuribacillus alkaliarsenatis]
MLKSLRWTIILSFVIITIISSALVNSVWKSWYVNDVQRLLEDKVVNQITYAAQITDEALLYDYLRFIKSSSDAMGNIFLYNMSLESYWSVDEYMLSTVENQEYILTLIDEFVLIDNLLIYQLKQFDEELYIVVKLNQESKLNSMLQYKMPVVYFFIAFLSIIGLLVGRFIWKDIFLPLDRITTVIKWVARGQFDHRIFVNRKDELYDLAENVNLMIQSSKEKVTELSDEKSKLEGVLNNMLSGVIVVNQHGNIEYVNSSAEKILNVKKDQIVMKNHQLLKAYGINNDIEKTLTKGEVFRDQITFTKGITERIVEISIIPIKNINRLITSVIIVLHDISDIKRLENMRAEFVANVSHEIKTPITSIKGFAETIIDGAIEDKDVTLDFTNIIYKESERLSNLVQDLLDLSKIESNTALEMQDDDIVEIATEVIQNLRNQLDKNHVDISLCSNKERILHLVNHDRIKQVFINLISNAIAYSKEESTVFVRIFDNERDVVIEVEDNGIGIPESDLARIFERFYRVHKHRSRATGGTGLGLSIVKHIVDVHQGKIDVDSNVGIGTTFRITLPKISN